jgi:GNAT superfamily N-acetyltransferase
MRSARFWRPRKTVRGEQPRAGIVYVAREGVLWYSSLAERRAGAGNLYLGSAAMNIVVKKLTPNLIQEYFDLFDNRAFSDRKGAFCYCTWFHFDCSLEEYYRNGKDSMRSCAASYIEHGKLNGYLAFVDGVSIGWCNTDDKSVYKRFKSDPFIQNKSTERVKAIVCFEVAPEFRSKGIATALLKKVIQDAPLEGYTTLESYPKLLDSYDPYDYTGPVCLYEKAGFVEIARQEKRMVMQKML